MSFALPFRLPASPNVCFLCLTALLLTTAAVISKVRRHPRPWPVDEVPVIFWAWRNQPPNQDDIRAAVRKTQARAIFLHAGQIDYRGGKLNRIRPTGGSLPSGIELHLVYNATRSLLVELEHVDEQELANSIAQAFEEDCRHAKAAQAQVAGIQIDLDVPTRLLSRYEQMLRALRAELQPGIQLSITGLPTWMQSSQLKSTLTQVDFWTPQFYGAEIPGRADQIIPISSVDEIVRSVDRARAIDKPFYAGLAAYSWALLYSKSGELISVRGDMDPATIAADANLDLIDQRKFDSAGEWRYEYRARAGGVTDGLGMEAGDLLVLDTPTSQSLRQSAHVVREWAGKKLLGICVFRLPAPDDPATLSIDEVAAALTDKEANPSFEVSLKQDDTESRSWKLKVENQGNGPADDLRIDLPVSPETVESVNAHGAARGEALCQIFNQKNSAAFLPCSQARADLIRIAASRLRPGEILTATITFKTTLPRVMPVSIESLTDTGRSLQDHRQLVTDDGAK